jgi:3-hydroxyisobutyrate dehydrogenase
MSEVSGPVAILGTGIMGYPMAERMLKRGVKVIAHNRTLEKALPLRQMGAEIAATPDQAIVAADIVLLMLADYGAIRAVLEVDGVLSALAGRTVVQMGTIGPGQSRELANLVSGFRADYLEAPVFGSHPQIEAGELLVLAAGERDLFKQVEPLLRCFGPPPYYLGEIGKAAAAKLALNLLIPALVTGFSLSLGIVQREDIQIDDFMAVLRQGAYYSPTFDSKLPRMLERRYDHPNFPLSLMLKDIELALEESEQLGLNTSILAAIRALYAEAVAGGLADLDHSGIYEAISPPTFRRAEP